VAVRHKGARFAGTALTFFNSQAALGITQFSRYDQEALVALALIRLYDLTSNNAYLLQARKLYEDVELHWDSSCCKFPPNNVPGGIWQDSSQTVKSTTTNAAAIIGGAELFVRTNPRISAYLTFAEEVYGYWSANMVDKATFQVYTSISSAGVDKTKLTVNEGLMMGAAVKLSAAETANSTPDPSRLALAHHLAGFMLAHETAPVPDSQSGTILSDGDDTSCTGECATYKGIAARYLGELYAADPSHTEYRDLLYRSAQTAWGIARDSASTGQTAGLFNTDWAAQFPGVGLLAASAAAETVLSAAATVEGAPQADPTDTFQADEAVLNYASGLATPLSVGLSNMNGGFGQTSWGYVSSWGCNPVCVPSGTNDGQSIELFLTTPAQTANLYALNFHYAAGNPDTDAGNPAFSRQLGVNGSDLGAVSFPTTGADWTTWANQAFYNVWLPPGKSSMTLVYDSTQGDVGVINLDQVRIAENLLQQQPVPGDWHTSFGTAAPSITSTTVMTPQGAEPAQLWVQSSIGVGQWIKIYPNDTAFSAALQGGSSYVASVTLSGSGSFYLDFYDGAPHPTNGDVVTPTVQLTSTPVTLTTPTFQYVATNAPEFQIRVDGTSGATVDVNMTMWNFAVYPAP
jgi:predicted alpha-1,6-mannanase (GH76 family)